MKLQAHKNFSCLANFCLAGLSLANFSLLVFCFFFSQEIKAADFSQVQQMVVPPSLIRRDLNALGTNDWNFPGLDSNTDPANSNPNPINSNPDFGVGTLINRGATAHIEDLGTVSQIQKHVKSLVKAGQLTDAENLARVGLKAYPNSNILKNQFAAITASEAQTFLQAQEYELAGKKARESLVADPNRKIAKSVDASVLRAQNLNPNLAEGHVAVGDKLTADGRLLEATVEYKLALEIQPNAAAHVGLGSIAIGKGQIAEASQHLQRALSIDPNSALAYRQRGALHYIVKDSVGASSDFSKAVSLNPNDPLAVEALIGLWKQQVAVYPKSANSHLGLARAYMQTQNLEAARGEYKTVVALDPNNPVLPAARASFKLALAKQEASKSVQAAQTLDSQGAWKEAHQKLTEALTFSPDDPQILLYNGQMCERLGLTKEAHDSYMSVLKSDPGNINAAARLKALGYNEQPLRAIAQPGFPEPIPAQANVVPSSSVPAIAAPPFAPFLNVKPGPIPEENLQNIPLKSPLPPKTQSNLPVPFGNAYYYADQDLYVGNSPQVTMLGNFGSCVRALIMTEKQFLKPRPHSEYANDNNDSENLSSNQQNYF